MTKNRLPGLAHHALRALVKRYGAPAAVSSLADVCEEASKTAERPEDARLWARGRLALTNARTTMERPL